MLPPALADGTDLADENAFLTRILWAIEEYVYTGEFLAGGKYRVLFAGPCRERFLGLPSEEARAAIWADYVDPRDREHFGRVHDEAHRTGRLDAEYRMVGADGVTRWVRDRGRVRVEGGRRFLDGSVLDVTAIRTAHEELERARAEADRLAHVDPLTGVANRRSLDALLARIDPGPGLGVLTVDVDRFKEINDLYGHAAGDAVLVALTGRLVAALRPQDVVVRAGGEEFLALLPGVDDDADLHRAAERVRRSVAAEPVATGVHVIGATVSVGGALADTGAVGHDAVLARSDSALYAAKRAGRNRVRVFDSDAEDGGEDDAFEPEIVRLARAMALTAGTAPGVDEAHLAEVSRLAARIARTLGVPPPQALRCRLVGLLHDIGKLGGPADGGAGHPAGGAALVAAIPGLAAMAPGVRHQLERFDGSGYPDGLEGEAIPLEARVVAVADAWSVLVSGCVDRAPLDRTEALTALRDAAGTQLDPRVVTALREEVAADEPAGAGDRRRAAVLPARRALAEP